MKAMTAAAVGGSLVKSAGKAVALGVLIESTSAAIHALYVYHRGELSARQAAVLVAKQSSNSAVSTAIGALAAVGFAAVTGVAGPAMALIWVGVSTVTKLGMQSSASDSVRRPATTAGAGAK